MIWLELSLVWRQIPRWCAQFCSALRIMGRADQLRDFQNYDFLQSSAFQAYKDSVEVISNDPATALRLKGRWYKKNIVSGGGLHAEA